jgi:hypothetical protein
MGQAQQEESMAAQDSNKLAVLIDADNAQAAVVQELLAEVLRHGTHVPPGRRATGSSHAL